MYVILILGDNLAVLNVIQTENAVEGNRIHFFSPPPRAGTKYSVAVFGMFDGGESMPLAGEEHTTLMDAPDPPEFDSDGIKAVCTNNNT